jgi:hypothetical protein
MARRAKSEGCTHRTRAWCALPPSSPYGCASPRIGVEVPGRNGGTVQQCATPSEKRPREGQWWVISPGGANAHSMRKATVSRRIRDSKRAPCDAVRSRLFDAAEYAATVAAIDDPNHVPAPTEYAWPHRHGQGRACTHHRVWSNWHAAIDYVRNWYRETHGRSPMPAELRAALEQAADFESWIAVERAEVEAWGRRLRAGRSKTIEGTERAAARHRQRARAAGVDLTSAEYLDTLGGGEGRRRRSARGTRR